VLVPHVPPDELDAPIQILRHAAPGVHRLLKGIENAHAETFAQQRIGGMRADEAGASC